MPISPPLILTRPGETPGIYRTGESPLVGDVVDGYEDRKSLAVVLSVDQDEIGVRPPPLPGFDQDFLELLSPSRWRASCCCLVRRRSPSDPQRPPVRTCLLPLNHPDGPVGPTDGLDRVSPAIFSAVLDLVGVEVQSKDKHLLPASWTAKVGVSGRPFFERERWLTFTLNSEGKLVAPLTERLETGEVLTLYDLTFTGQQMSVVAVAKVVSNETLGLSSSVET